MKKRKIRMLFAALVLFMPSFVVTADAGAQDEEDYIYKLTQSNGSYEFWTTLPAERVFKDDAVPADTGSGVLVYAARKICCQILICKCLNQLINNQNLTQCFPKFLEYRP